MTAAIQARSLAPLTALAANPPRYPRNPTQDTHQPLVLYISRVPGSRDIILTPVKPQQDTITAQHVAVSLYYLHLHDPRRDGEVDTADSTQKAPLGSVTEAVNRSSREEAPLHRKAVPGHEEVETEDSPTTLHEEIPNSTVPRRRPLGPRPENGTTSLPGDEENSTPTSGSSVPKRKSLASGSVTITQHLTTTPMAVPKIAEPVPPLPPRPSRPILTLIRRDQTSGAQWNVGSITVHDGASHPAVNVQVSTPGYVQFADSASPGKFMRTVRVNEPDTDSVSTNTGTRRRGSSLSSLTDLRSSLQSMPARMSHRAGSPSDALHKLTGQGNKSGDRKRGVSPRKPYYTFRSPWDGRCEFSTGLAGRSLKCKHTLPKDEAPVAVSELRFSLPRLLGHRASDSQDSSRDEEDDSSGMHLGREKAGGGVSGKKAKLGKLIIYDEGLRMVDLLVAANMGVWWTIYDRMA